jgi:hypothetical protein
MLWSCRLDGTRLPKRDLQIKFKRKRPLGCLRMRYFTQVLEYITKRRNGWEETEKERVWEEIKDWRILVH